MTEKISYVRLSIDWARKLDLPVKFLTDVELPLHVKEAAEFIAQGHNFEQMTPRKDRHAVLPEGVCIDMSVRSETLTRVLAFKPPRK